MTYKLKVFSFGAGVQSTALMLLLQHEPERLLAVMGHLPDVAFFADTGAEVSATHTHFAKMEAMGFPIRMRVVSNGSILGGSQSKGNRSFAPYFTRNPEGEVAMLMRKCTSEFKIIPINRGVREELGLKRRQWLPKEGVAMWIGISTDEADRMKPDPNPRVHKLYPLIELGWSRQDCEAYSAQFNIFPPKSRCFMCPFIKDWISYRRDHPWDFKRAVEFDHSIRHPHAGFNGEAYLHRLCVPLEEAVDLMALKEATYGTPLFDDGFSAECTGMCGT